MIIGNLLFLCFLICLIRASNSGVLQQYCSSTYDPTSSSGEIYKSNLNFLLSSLTSFASRTKNGFYYFTAGRSPSNKVYGLFLCRGDVSSEVCKKCVATASSEILRKCQDRKIGILWYDVCLLRYSDQDIFSMVDTSTSLILVNTKDATDVDMFNKVLGETLDKIANKAANDRSGKKFAVEEAKYSTFERKIYALGQCTPDLSSQDCGTCLSYAISKFPECCRNRQGARVIFPSCGIDYEIYPFFSTPTGNNDNRGTSTLREILTNVGLIFVAILLLAGATCLARRSRNEYHALFQEDGRVKLQTRETLQHDFKEIQAATFNFAIGNQIGQGGFGPVYKGALPDGQEIAVKRLSRSSNQGSEEFKNEIELVSKLQHRNLVRLVGFCVEGEEMLLIYEFVINKSLNYYLFDPEKQALLDWSTRYKIIEGIARGILYLHEDSQLKIIHRDLKASNVLLDKNMNPKIADFGMARLIGDDQYEEQTRKRAGTLSYMAPEYLIHGRFSVKSDIFSFGILILEIVSGKKRSKFDQERPSWTDDFLSYAWRQWRDKTPLALVDPSLGDSYVKNEVIQSIHVGLLCVEHDAEQRPTISSVLLMLKTLTIPTDHLVTAGLDSTVQQVEEPEFQDYHIQDDEGLRKNKDHLWSIFTHMKRKKDLPT